MSKGTSAVGEVNSASMTKLNAYIEKLPDLVRPYWKLPSYLMDRNLKCRIRIFLSKNGDILNAIIFETSGDDEYDKRSLTAVKKANPFPPLEDEFVDKGNNGEILLGFPL
jgi:TonB family protein